MAIVQCNATCKNGKRCTRAAKYNGYCKLHCPIDDHEAVEKSQEVLEEIEGIATSEDSGSGGGSMRSDDVTEERVESGGGEGGEGGEGGDDEVEGGSKGMKDILIGNDKPEGITRDKRILINPLVNVDETEERARLKKKYKKKKREVFIHPSIVNSIQDFVKDFLKSHPRCSMRTFQNIISSTWKEYKSEMASHIELNDYQKFMRDNIKLLDDELSHKDKVKRIGALWNEKKAKKIAVCIRKNA